MGQATSAEGTVAKALDVLEKVAAYGGPVRFSKLLEDSRFPKATLYRLLQTLTKQGMVSFDPDSQTYSLGVRLVRLAHQAWRQSSLAPIARPHIDALSRMLAETVHLAQLDNGQVLYVDKRNAKDPIEMFSQAGKVGPAYCTGVGKAMLAFLDTNEQDRVIAQQSFHQFTNKTLTSSDALRRELETIKNRGFSFDDEEHEPGIICVSLPILAQSGRVLGGLSITSTTTRHSLKSLEGMVPEMKQAVSQIGLDAEAWRFPEQLNKSAL